MAELTTEQFEAAQARGAERLRGPRATRAHYDAGRDRVIVRLTTGVEIGFAPRDAEGLQNAQPICGNRDLVSAPCQGRSDQASRDWPIGIVLNKRRKMF